MRKKNVFLGVILLASLGLLLSFTPGHSQTDGKLTPEMQQTANNILQSPLAAYLSGTGRNALEHAAGLLPLPQALRRGQAQESGMPTAALPLPLAPVPGAEVMVNNPALDPEPFDISTQSETAVAGFGSNIVVAYNNSATIFSSPSVMGYSRSTDGGLTFTDLRGLPAPVGGFNEGDPGLVADRIGNFYVCSIAFNPSRPPGFAFTVGISKSTNGGATFGTPVSPPAAGVPAGSFQDKMFIAVDNSGGPFNGNVYVTWTSFAPPPSTKLPIMLSRSSDGGATFSTPIQISTPTEFDQGSAPIVGPDGAVYVAWERFFESANPFAPPAIVVAKSTDGGLTFGSPVVVAPVADIGFGAGTMLGNFRVNSFPRIDVNPTTGTVHIVFASNPQPLPPTPPTGDSGDIWYTRSIDGAATWAAPVKLNDDITLNDQFFPVVAVNGDGEFVAYWYDKRNDAGNRMIDLFETTSLDDGVSFSPNTQVNAVSFPPAVGYDPVINRIYMGDYIDIKAITTPTGPGKTFLRAWGDNRRKIVTFGGTRNDQDVFFVLGD